MELVAVKAHNCAKVGFFCTDEGNEEGEFIVPTSKMNRSNKLSCCATERSFTYSVISGYRTQLLIRSQCNLYTNPRYLILLIAQFRISSNNVLLVYIIVHTTVIIISVLVERIIFVKWDKRLDSSLIKNRYF